MGRPNHAERDRRAVTTLAMILADPEYQRVVATFAEMRCAVDPEHTRLWGMIRDSLRALVTPEAERCCAEFDAPPPLAFVDAGGVLVPSAACDGPTRERFERACAQYGLEGLVTPALDPRDYEGHVLNAPTLLSWPPRRRLRDRAAFRRFVIEALDLGGREAFGRDRLRQLRREHYTQPTAPLPAPAATRDPRARSPRGRVPRRLLPQCLAITIALHPPGRMLPRVARGERVRALATAQGITPRQVRRREKIADALMARLGPSIAERLREHAEACQPCAWLTRTAGRWCPDGERLIRAMLRDHAQTQAK